VTPQSAQLRALPDADVLLEDASLARRYHARLWSALDRDLAAGAEHARSRRYFASLDRATTPVLLPYALGDRQQESLRRWAVGAVFHVLRQRFLERAQPVSPGSPVRPARMPPSELHRLEHVELLQRRLLEEQFGAGSALDRPALADAFVAFASGRLALPLEGLAVACQPSGGTYFLFGEFALLVHDHAELFDGETLATWRRAAGPMIATQELFARRYAAPLAGGPRSLDDFGPEHVVLSSAENERLTRSARERCRALADADWDALARAATVTARTSLAP